MNGGAGNDILAVDGSPGPQAPPDVANGGDGNDTLQIDAGANSFGNPFIPYLVAADIETVQVVSATDRVAIVLNGLDNLYGGFAGVDYANGGAGNDTMYGRGGADAFFGDDGNDRLFGEAGGDNLFGGNGNDLLYGGADEDQLTGDSGNDTLYGESGSDTLRGSGGVDQLYGGLGSDRFELQAVTDSGTTVATGDRIRDFSRAQGDQISLLEIDAITGGANDAFSFIGTAAFTNVAGQLRYQVVAGETRVTGDVNGDGVADFLIRIDGVHTLSAADFIL